MKNQTLLKFIFIFTLAIFVTSAAYASEVTGSLSSVNSVDGQGSSGTISGTVIGGESPRSSSGGSGGSRRTSNEGTVLGTSTTNSESSNTLAYDYGSSKSSEGADTGTLAQGLVESSTDELPAEKVVTTFGEDNETKSSAWFWIILIVLLLIVVGMYMYNNGSENKRVRKA